MDGEDGSGRRHAPAAARNLAPIREALVERLAGIDGEVLEIGAGTGEHAVALARALPALRWWPTDPSPEALGSIAAHRAHGGPGNLMPPVALDASGDWRLGTDGRPPTTLAAVFAANVLHIAPEAVGAGLLAGAARHLRPGGLLLVYGPFRRDGVHTAPSNADFDARLRARDPAWGVRCATELAARAADLGLRERGSLRMPANNELLVLERDGQPGEEGSR
jgi:SAM-dependent methyltransferase